MTNLKSEWALLPGMFTHMNLFWWQASQQQDTDNERNNIQIYKIDYFVCYVYIWNVNKYVTSTKTSLSGNTLILGPILTINYTEQNYKR